MLSIFFYLYSIQINTNRKDRLSPKNWFTSFFVLNIIRDISRTSTTYIMGLLNGLLLLTNVTKKKEKRKYIYIYVTWDVYSPMSLLGELFPMFLLVRHIGQLVTNGEIVKVARSLLCRIVARRDIISTELLQVPTISTARF